MHRSKATGSAWRCCWVLALALAAALAGRATAALKHKPGWAESEVPQAAVPLLPKAPTVDGRIEPGEWRGALQFTGFSLPLTFVNVLPAALQSQVWIGYDRSRLYLALRAPKVPGHAPRIARRDASYEMLADAHWWLKFHTPRGGFEFLVNPLGALSDRNDANSYTPRQGLEWDSGAEVRCTNAAPFWEAELSIPFAPMGLPEGPALDEEWRVHLIYGHRHGHENDSDWNGAPNYVNDRCGRLVFGGEVPAFRLVSLSGLEDLRLAAAMAVANLTARPEAVTIRVAIACATQTLWTAERTLRLAPGEEQPFDVRKGEIVLPEGFTGRVEIDADTPTNHLYSMIVQFGRMTPADYRFLSGVFYPFPSRLREVWTLSGANYPYYRCMDVWADVSHSTLPEATRQAAACEVGLFREGRPRPLRTDTIRLEGMKGRIQWRGLDLADGAYALRGQLKAGDGRAVGAAVEHPFERRVFPWEHNRLGISDTVYPPFTPIQPTAVGVPPQPRAGTCGAAPLPAPAGRGSAAAPPRAGDRIPGGKGPAPVFRVWGRECRIGDCGLPAGIVATDETDVPGQVICGPFRLELAAGGTNETLRGAARVTRREPGVVEVRSAATSGSGLAVETAGRLSYDGWYQVRLRLVPKAPAAVDRLEMVIPFGEYPDTHYGYRHNWFYGALPAGRGVLWHNVGKEGNEAGNLFTPALAVGNGDVALWWYANSDAAWRLDYAQPSQLITRDADGVNVRIVFINHPAEVARPLEMEFAVLANPAKPMPPDRRAIVWGLKPQKLFHDTGGYGFWGSGVDSITCGTDAEYRRFREFLDRWTGRTRPGNEGFQVVLYNSGQAIGRCMPEFETFSGEWRGETPWPVTPEFKDSDSAARVGLFHQSANYYQDWRGQPKKLVPGWADLVPSMVDCRLWYYRRNIEKLGVNGYWFDNQPMWAGNTLATGRAYLTADGKQRPNYNLFERQSLFRRLFVITKEAGLEPRNLISYGPDFSFAQWIWMIEMDAYVDGAEGDMFETLSRRRWYDIVSRVITVEDTPLDPVARHRAITRMRSVPGATHSNVQQGNIRGSRSVIGLALLHDFGVATGVDYGELARARKALRRFDFGDAAVQYLPYWRNARYGRFEAAGTVMSLYYNPATRAALAVLVNPADAPAEGELTLAPAAFGIERPVLLDLESGERPAATPAGDGLRVRVAVPRRDYRLMVLRPFGDEDVRRGVTGTLDREYWLNVDGLEVKTLIAHPRYPDQPDGRDALAGFESVSWTNRSVNRDFAQRFGERIRGYLVPRETGDYVFWVAAADQTQLLLSSDEKPENARLVAEVPQCTGFRQWPWQAEAPNKSKPARLIAGRPYYVEALRKKNVGGCWLTVGWTTPFEDARRPTQEPIPVEVLSSFSAGIPPERPAAP